MALLSIGKRKKYFADLGLGEYNNLNVRKFQAKYFIRSKDIDGIYGKDTDALLRHVYICSMSKYFAPFEFKCECGGKYCTGYPTYINERTLKFMDQIRIHYNKPVYVTSGLRCRTFNSKINGASSTSKHVSGKAVDYYINGVTNTLSGRINHIKLIKKMKNHDYSYCNGFDSLNNKPIAPNMGNAVHTQTL